MKDWLSRCNQTKEKHLLPSFYITRLVCSTYNFLTTGTKLLHVPSIFTFLVFTLLLSLHSYAARRSYRNHVKEISENFKDLAKVGLAVLKKIVIFWIFQNGSINVFKITSQESWFLIKKCFRLKDMLNINVLWNF